MFTLTIFVRLLCDLFSLFASGRRQCRHRILRILRRKETQHAILVFQIGIQEDCEDAEEHQRYPGDQNKLGHYLTASSSNPAAHLRRHRQHLVPFLASQLHDKFSSRQAPQQLLSAHCAHARVLAASWTACCGCESQQRSSIRGLARRRDSVPRVESGTVCQRHAGRRRVAARLALPVPRPVSDRGGMRNAENRLAGLVNRAHAALAKLGK